MTGHKWGNLKWPSGLAHGKGKAKGIDTYEGDFKQGNKHGKGAYTWSSGSKYVGDFIDDVASGFGKRIILKKDEARLIYFQSTSDVKGREDGDVVIFEGIFLDGGFIVPCTSLQHCEEEKNRLQSEKDKEIKEKEKEEKRELYGTIAFYLTVGIFLVAAPWIMLRKKLAIFKIISNTALARTIQMLIMFWFLFFVEYAFDRFNYHGFDEFNMERIPSFLIKPLDGMFEIATYPMFIFPIIAYLILIWVINFLVKRRKSKTI